MTKFFKKDTTLVTAKLSRDNLWVENSEEHVDANCALPPYSVETLPPAFVEGQWPKWFAASKSWRLINDCRYTPFYDATGTLYLPTEVETDYPNWSIFTKPPAHNPDKEELLFVGGKWHIYVIVKGLAFFNDDGFVGHAGNYFELEETETFEALPLEWADGFVPIVKNSTWYYKSDTSVLTYEEMLPILHEQRTEKELEKSYLDEEEKTKDMLDAQVMRVMRRIVKTHLESIADLSEEDALTLRLIYATEK